MWKRRFERIILSYDYTAQNTWRIAKSIEAKSRRRGCNAAIVCPSVSLPLSVWLNVSLSAFAAPFFVVLSRIFFSFFLSLPPYSTYCADLRLSLFLDLLTFPFSFCLLCLLSLQNSTSNSHSSHYYISFSWNPRNPLSCSYLTVRFS